MAEGDDVEIEDGSEGSEDDDVVGTHVDEVKRAVASLMAEGIRTRERAQ